MSWSLPDDERYRLHRGAQAAAALAEELADLVLRINDDNPQRA
jgi:hypothetical protein